MRVSLRLSAISLFFFLSCQSENKIMLNRAASLIHNSPDSALFLLSSITVDKINHNKERAQYALLMSAAMDKNYIDVASDSLTRIAVDYYSLHQNRYYRMLAWYYHGLVLMNAQSYSSSIVALEKARNEAYNLNDDYYSGLILRNEAKVFSLTNNNPAAIDCQQKAIHFFEKAGKDSYKEFAETDLAIYLTNNQEFEKADSLFSYIRQAYDNQILNRYCNVCQAEINVELKKNPEDALSLFRRVSRSHYSVPDYAYLALAHERLHQKDSADYWIREGYKVARNQSDSAYLHYPHAHLEATRGHYEKAFHLIDYAASVQDSLTRILLQQSVSSAQRDYYKSETLLQEEKIQSMRQRTLFGIVFGILIMSLLAMTAVIRSRKKDQLLQKQMARLALEERELERVNRDNAHLVGSLFSEKIDHLDRLSESYFKMDEGKEKEALFKQIKQTVSALRKDQGMFLSLENDLDRYCNGIMSKLRDQVPRISGDNRRIIALFFAGYSYETVKLILNKVSVESLKTARSRFRKEIKESGAPDTDFFLKMLEMKKRPQAGTNESNRDC